MGAREELKEKTHLPDHDTAVPALGLGLLHARAERGGGDEAVRRVRRGRGLANDELVERDAVLGDLEERRARECAARAREQARAVAVEALVVELHVVLRSGVRLSDTVW